jgi:hypothetical protein
LISLTAVFLYINQSLTQVYIIELELCSPAGNLDRILWPWNEAMNRVRERRTFSLTNWVDAAEAQALPRPQHAPRFTPKHRRISVVA